MATWFEVEKSNKGIKNFLDSNWSFHDFRSERIEYVPEKDFVEIFLKYDTGDHGVLLRFVWVHDIHINTKRDHEGEWLNGSIAFVLENKSIIWLDDDAYGDDSKAHLEEIKKYTTWVEAERLFWAITDADGNPVDMPKNRMEQVWITYGVEEKKVFDLKVFIGDWNLILRPYYKK